MKMTGESCKLSQRLLLYQQYRLRQSQQLANAKADNGWPMAGVMWLAGVSINCWPSAESWPAKWLKNSANVSSWPSVWIEKQPDYLF